METRVHPHTEKAIFRAPARPTLPRPTALNTDCDGQHMVIVHPSRLFRDCLKQSLGDRSHRQISDFATLDDALREAPGDNLRLMIVGLKSGDIDAERPRLLRVMEYVRAGSDPMAGDGARDVRVIATGDSEDPYFVVKLLKMGVRGYIPASLDLDVTLQALDLVLAGGVFAPASCLIAMSEAPRADASSTPGDLAGLTRKQMAVIEAIRQGKANKTIAYELNMCESTVKVHVRNIMKKLGAKNRTHVAYIANNLILKSRE